MKSLGSDQLAAVSRLFSSTVIRELARRGKSPIFARLAKQSRLRERPSSSDRVSSIFDEAFSLMRQEGYRHEYIYKAALTHRVLLGTHSLQTASMLTEFRVGDCKADLVIFNGTATVYEVKSERDSLNRLERQLAAYSRVFAKVYVIAAEHHLESVEKLVPKHVGILCLNRRYQISTLREAADEPQRTSQSAIFDAIRTQEARMILERKGVSIPTVPNTALNANLRRLFVRLDPCDAHHLMVQVVKKTRNLLPLSDLVDQLPTSLHTAALSIPLRKVDHDRLVLALNTPLKDAFAWA